MAIHGSSSCASRSSVSMGSIRDGSAAASRQAERARPSRRSPSESSASMACARASVIARAQGSPHQSPGCRRADGDERRRSPGPRRVELAGRPRPRGTAPIGGPLAGAPPPIRALDGALRPARSGRWPTTGRSAWTSPARPVSARSAASCAPLAIPRRAHGDQRRLVRRPCPRAPTRRPNGRGRRRHRVRRRASPSARPSPRRVATASARMAAARTPGDGSSRKAAQVVG